MQGAGPRPVPACLVGYRDRSNPTQRSRRCGQSPVAENPPHRPGGWATNLVAPSFGLAKGIIVKSGLDSLRAADLSSPQWSIRLRSVRVLKGGTFMLQSSSSIETRDLWIVASVALGVMTMAFDAAWVITVALKEIAARVQSQRLPVRWRGSAPAPAASG